MVSGPDVITYIGVPLAVVGVLPIIFNTVSTLLTLAKVRRALRHGRLTGITRGDVVNHVIEVELPRYTIAPLHREEQSEEYWRLCEYPSQIPGGTWTTFNWKYHAVGFKTQRIDYADQLRQPQAEIGFEELVSFLLDLGAVPDPIGFRMLRGSGLWVPAGTILLRSPDQEEAVLSVATLDDSDGNLSLAVRWSSNWGMRDSSSLPPYWVRIKSPITIIKLEKSTVLSEELVPDNPSQKNEAKIDENIRSSAASKYTPNLTNIRCQIGINGITAAIRDDCEPDLFEPYDIKHLEIHETVSNPIGIFFASSVTALGTTSQTILWNYKIPSEVLSFSKRESIPCGILVMLNIIPESITPEWASTYPHDEEIEREEMIRKQNAKMRKMLESHKMTPEQRSASFFKDYEEELVDSRAKINERRRRDEERAETKMLEALQSPKWSNRLIAEHMLKWLKKEGHVSREDDEKVVVEMLLWKMVTDSSFALELGNTLDKWNIFVDNGGMRRADYIDLQGRLVMFGYASLILALIEHSVTASSGSLAMDLQECVRVWKRVRLG